MKHFKQILFTGLIISTAMKYGPNGYLSSGANSFYSGCTSTKHTSTCITTETEGTTIADRIMPVMGFTLQTVPDRFGFSLGLGYYFDQTATLSLGIRL